MNHNLSELELKAQLLKKITHAQQYCATVQPPPNAKGSKGEAYFPADFIVETLSATLPPLGLTFITEATECTFITEAPPILSKSKDNSTPCEQITVTVKVTVYDLETGYSMEYSQTNTEKTLTSSKSASVAISAARNKLLQQIFHFYATKPHPVTERRRSEQSRNERRQNEQSQNQTQNHQTPPPAVTEPKRAIADISIPDMEIYITPPEESAKKYPPITEGQKGQIMSIIDHLTEDKAGTLQNVQKIINVCGSIPPTYILMLNGIIANRLYPDFTKMMMSSIPTTSPKLPALTDTELETLLPILKQKVNGKKLNSIKTEFITELKKYNCGNAVIWNAILGAITCRIAHFQQHNN